MVLVDGGTTRIVSVRNKRDDCRFNASLTLSADKQRLVCDGPTTNKCGMRNVPPPHAADADTDTWFIKYVSMDLHGLDHWYCSGFEKLNRYTFTGSYYHAYVKMASCSVPTGLAADNEFHVGRESRKSSRPQTANHVSMNTIK